MCGMTIMFTDIHATILREVIKGTFREHVQHLETHQYSPGPDHVSGAVAMRVFHRNGQN